MAEDDKERQGEESAESADVKPAETTSDSGERPEAGGESDTPDVPGRETAEKTVSRGRSHMRGSSSGIAYIKATFNNTFVSITDNSGGVIAWSSAGRAGFKGSRKSTAFAATMVGQDAARQAFGKGMREVEVRIQGAGSGRESAIRALQTAGLNVTAIRDVTPIPHNGCRPRKRRRV